MFMGAENLAVSDRPPSAAGVRQRDPLVETLDGVFGKHKETVSGMVWTNGKYGAYLVPASYASGWNPPGDGGKRWRLFIGQRDGDILPLSKPHLSFLISYGSGITNIEAEPGLAHMGQLVRLEQARRYRLLENRMIAKFGQRINSPPSRLQPKPDGHSIALGSDELKPYILDSLYYLRPEAQPAAWSLLESLVAQGMRREHAEAIAGQLPIEGISRNIRHGKNASHLVYLPEEIYHVKFPPLEEYIAERRVTDLIEVCPQLGDIIHPTLYGSDGITVNGCRAAYVMQSVLPNFKLGTRRGANLEEALDAHYVELMQKIADMAVLGTYAMYAKGFCHKAKDMESDTNLERIDRVEHGLRRDQGFSDYRGAWQLLRGLGLGEGISFVHADITGPNIMGRPEDPTEVILVDGANSGFGNIMRDIASSLTQYEAHAAGRLADNAYMRYIKVFVDRLRSWTGEPELDETEAGMAFKEFQAHQLRHIIQNPACLLDKPYLTKGQRLTLCMQLDMRQSLEKAFYRNLPDLEKGLWSTGEMARLKTYLCRLHDTKMGMAEA